MWLVLSSAKRVHFSRKNGRGQVALPILFIYATHVLASACFEGNLEDPTLQHYPLTGCIDYQRHNDWGVGWSDYIFPHNKFQAFWNVEKHNDFCFFCFLFWNAEQHNRDFLFYFLVLVFCSVSGDSRYEVWSLLSTLSGTRTFHF